MVHQRYVMQTTSVDLSSTLLQNSSTCTCIHRSENIKPRLNKCCSFLKRQLFANESIYIPQTFSTDTAITHAGLVCGFPYQTYEDRSENTFTWHIISQLKETTPTDISVTCVTERSLSVSGAEVNTAGHELNDHCDWKDS